MKVLVSYPGHLRTVPQSGYAIRAFRELGCEVVTFDHGHKQGLDRLVKHLSKDAFKRRRNAALRRLIAREKPDLVFVLYGKIHDAELISEIRATGAKTACWWLDDPFSFGLDQDFAQAAAFDRYYTNCRGSVADYQAKGLGNVSFLPCGCSPDISPVVDIPEHQKDIDVLFIGDWHPLRQQAMESLIGVARIGVVGPWVARKTGVDAPIRGHLTHEGYFTPAEMLTWFARARIVLNLHTWYGRWSSGVNPRLFEASGANAFQLCDHKEEIPDLYVPDREIVLYSDPAEIPDLVRKWPPRAEERAAIARAAMARSQRDHTYVARMRQVLTDVGLSAPA
jgi:spore maturation protein CgeB